MDDELRWIATVTGSADVRRGERIQSLWGGYGEIFRVQLDGPDGRTAIVKSVKPPARGRDRPTDASHARKCRSYHVEAAWYRRFASRCDSTCRVPGLIDSRVSGDRWLFLLEDLDAAGFPQRRHQAGPAELDRCLAWLAAFHARFLGVAPEGLWTTGTYWHLATRPDELAAMDSAELRAAAPLLDQKLRSCAFQTFVHGDAKLANFCFSTDSLAVAAVDFQYVGGGCGMKDVAYLLSGECSSAATEQRHLDAYFGHLRAALTQEGRAGSTGGLITALETEWRGLYPIACADFYRFLAGWAKGHWRSDDHGQQLVRKVLRTLG
jgi:hypothetical protein